MSQPTLRLSVAKASSGSVLLVQDRQAARAYVEPLAEAGYNVVIAPNTKVGLEEAMMGAFDVVLCDVDTPDGVVDMLSIIQAYEPDLPLVLLGENAPPSSSHSIATLTLLERMAKPVSVKDVLRIVEAAMDHKRDSMPGIDLRTETKDVTPFATRMTAPAMAATPAAFSPPMSGIPSSTGITALIVPAPISVVTPGPISGAPVTARSLLPHSSKPTSPSLMPTSADSAVPTPAAAISIPAASGVRAKTTRQPTLIAFKPEDTAAMLEEVVACLRVELDPVFDTNALRVIGYEVRVIADRTALDELLAVGGAKSEELYRRKVRELAASRFVESTRAQMKLFMDIGPADILDTDLYAPESPLAQIGERVVLQLRSAGTLTLDDLGARTSVLRFLGFQIAIADLDVGVSRLSLIGDLAPEFMKLDASLIRDLHAMPAKRRVVEGLMTMCRLLGTTPIAEGVSSIEERSMLVAIGCTLVQGPLQSDDLPSSASKPRWSRVRTPSTTVPNLARTGSMR